MAAFDRRVLPRPLPAETARRTIHIDVKKPGRIPEGGGRRLLGKANKTGYDHLQPKRGRDYFTWPFDDATKTDLIGENRAQPDRRAGVAPRLSAIPAPTWP